MVRKRGDCVVVTKYPHSLNIWRAGFAFGTRAAAAARTGGELTELFGYYFVAEASIRSRGRLVKLIVRPHAAVSPAFRLTLSTLESARGS